MSCLAQAQKMPVLTDTAVTSSAEIFRRLQEDSVVEIRNKYSDLQKNFTPHYLLQGLSLDCRGAGKPQKPDYSFASIMVNNKHDQLSSGHVQTDTSVTHTDCFGSILFVERVRVIAPSKVEMDVSEAVRFVRKFEVSEAEISRSYRIEDAKGESLFSTLSVRYIEPNIQRIYTTVHFGPNLLAQVSQIDKGQQERRLTLQANPGRYVGGATVFIINGVEGRRSYLLDLIWNDRQLIHYLNENAVSQIEFEDYLGILLLNNGTSLLKGIYSNFISKMPQTKKVQSGVADSPFLRELQLNYNRLVTNTEIAQTKLFLQKTIEDIKAGRLKVE